ncbi:hypothetical protein [Rhizobium paknamense]|uniref:Type III secretion protein n=1 Tax=Rhizobium paknamense TaxID=1206817 RepID=A0ABU0IGN8_9HYPH|nr:hypothetical protein [Rhizobium paknamense]MDQ0456384.1 hypothetical protein [Rhizobium paknamense]
MRTIVRQVPEAIRDAHGEVALMERVQWLAVKDWPALLGSGLAERMFAPQTRLARRGLETVMRHGDNPLQLQGSVRRLFIFPPETITMLAAACGLAYHLPAFGAVLDRKTLAKLQAQLGEAAVSLVLGQPVAERASIGLIDPVDAKCFETIRADGWALLHLWADLQGLSRLWRRHWLSGERGSASLDLRSGMRLVEELVSDLAYSGGA